MVLTLQDVETIGNVLGAPTDLGDGTWFWNLRDESSGRVLALTVSANVTLGDENNVVIVSAQTHQGYVELHGVTSYLCIEPDEVMFVTKNSDSFCSLVVGKTCTCSQFSNIRPSLLKADFTELDPAALMAAMQLSLVDSMLESLH